MARRRGRLTILILLCIFAAGCTSAPKAEWGDVEVSISSGVADIESNLGPESVDFEQDIVDCDGGVVSLEGRLATSTFYTSHESSTDLTYATVAAVAIEEMKFSDATEVAEGAGIRVQVEDWKNPLRPDTTGGTGDLTSKDTLQGEWFVIAIIPGSESIAEGLGIIEDWHQAVKMKGWLVGEMLGGEVSDSCKLNANAPGSGSNFLSATLIITEIETQAGVVSLDGDSDDEWVLGDIPIVGRWGYLVLFLILGFGGGAGLFVYSTMMIRKSADDAALTLMGEESFSAAKSVDAQAKLDAESDEGLERSRRRPDPKPKPEPEPEEQEVQIAGFSLDNVLSSSSSSDSAPREAGGGGVVATQESEDLDRTVKSAPPTTTAASSAPTSMSMPSISSSPPEASGSAVTTSPGAEPKRGHFSSVMSSSASPSSDLAPRSETQKKVRKKRSVKKAAAPEPEPQPEPQPAQQSRTSIADDDFDDFSL